MQPWQPRCDTTTRRGSLAWNESARATLTQALAQRVTAQSTHTDCDGQHFASTSCTREARLKDMAKQP